MTFSQDFLKCASTVLDTIDVAQVELLADGLASARAEGGRLFVLGVGGSAANASHAVADFRKLCDIEAYTPTDNVAELTARTNDEGWETSLSGWLVGSRVAPPDALLVFSVGGGDADRGISTNLIAAVDLASKRGLPIFAVVGRGGGHVGKVATAAVIIPPLFPHLVTALTEGIAGVVLHLLVSHPLLATHTAKWESAGEDRHS